MIEQVKVYLQVTVLVIGLCGLLALANWVTGTK